MTKIYVIHENGDSPVEARDRPGLCRPDHCEVRALPGRSPDRDRRHRVTNYDSDAEAATGMSAMQKMAELADGLRTILCGQERLDTVHGILYSGEYMAPYVENIIQNSEKAGASMNYWNLLIAFTRANLLGYGGGPSVIPLIKVEVVDTFRWLSAEEFADALAIGNTLPGPIATKMSAYIGYKVAGPVGALSGLMGTVLPTALLMVALAAVLINFKDSAVVKGMIKGVKPVVFVLFVLLAIEFVSFARPDKAGWVPAALAVGAFVGIYFFQVHQALAILAAVLIGGFFIR